MMYNNNANTMMNNNANNNHRRDSVQFMDPGSVDSSYRENSESDSSSQHLHLHNGNNNNNNNNNGSGVPSPMFNNQLQYGFQPSTNPDENFKVAVRVRPPIPRETDGARPFVNVVRIGSDSKSITLCEHLETEDGRGGGVYSTQSYTFDRVYGPESKQSEVYENSARYAVNAMLQGYNATLLGYGQTSTGKTFTLEGFSADENRGIVPRSTEHVFTYIQQQMQQMNHHQGSNQPAVQFQVRASYVQIYNEIVSDLLKPGAQDKQLTIRQAKNRVYVDGLSEWVVRSPNEIYGLMERGTALRATGKTRLSELSSRSHAIFIIIVETIGGNNNNGNNSNTTTTMAMDDQQQQQQSFKVGKLNIVDLAGSEKVRQAGVSGLRLEETKKINWSLHELGNVISALTDPNRVGRHIPYRNSKLTHLLTDSLGGNCKTTLIACISPALESYSESLSTLKFANRAKNIKNDATVNDDVNDPRSIAMKYERELKRLRLMLAEKNGGVMPPGVMDGNLLGGGGNNMMMMMGGGNNNNNMNGNHHQQEGGGMNLQTWRLQERVRDLEMTLQSQGIVVNADGTVSGKEGSLMNNNNNNNNNIENEEDKAQVERYKQLLLKQRDIMLNLTTRLNERDESILRLQEEIDAYDNHVQSLEDQLALYQESGANPNFNSTSSPSSSYLGSGKIYSSDEADQWISSRRVVGRDGNVKFLAETAAGIPSNTTNNNSNNNNNQLLSAESKMRELLMCGAIANTSSASLTSSSSATNFEVLENVLRNRIDASLRNILRGKTLTLQQELHNTKEALRSAEQRLQLAEATLHAATGGDSIEHVKQTLRATTDAALQMKLDRALDELKRERSEKNHYATELERLSTEVAIIDQKLNGFANNSSNGKSGAQIEELRQDVSRLCSVFANIENEFGQDEDNLFAKWVVAPVSSSSSSNSSEADNNNKKYQEQVAALQATIDNLRRQQQKSAASSVVTSPTPKENELTKMLDERTKSYRKLEQEHRQLQQNQQGSTNEIQELRRALATHTKDRKALRTILDSRIRVKVDNALQSILQAQQQQAPNSNGALMISQQQEKYLKQELSALQNLVNASIQAMDADNP